LDEIDDETDLELLEIQDQAETIGKLTPREYAKARGMNPQLMYYYIRTGVVKDERCICGRRVLDVRTTDEVLQTKAATRGRVLDTRSDDARPVDPRGGKE
jgi:hypothetical protein